MPLCGEYQTVSVINPRIGNASDGFVTTVKYIQRNNTMFHSILNIDREYSSQRTKCVCEHLVDTNANGHLRNQIEVSLSIRISYMP